METTAKYQNAEARSNTAVVREGRPAQWSDLTRKVDRYLARLEELEKRCNDPGEDRNSLLETITLLNDSILLDCAEYEEQHSEKRELISAAQDAFRLKTGPLLLKSHFIRHARTWPRGYQGDYGMLEGVYRNIPLSEGIGWFLDRYSLSTTLASAVREREGMLRSFLSEQLRSKEELKVLNVACGSCREVFELSAEIKHRKAKFTCIDFDAEAIKFSDNRLHHAGIPENQLALLQYNALKLVNKKRNAQTFGGQDVVYSVGFFDYLKDKELTQILGALYELLLPGGVLIASFKDCTRYSSQYYHWMVKWDQFYKRTQEDCWALFPAAGIPLQRIEMARDSSGVIMFFKMTKQ